MVESHCRFETEVTDQYLHTGSRSTMVEFTAGPWKLFINNFEDSIPRYPT